MATIGRTSDRSAGLRTGLQMLGQRMYCSANVNDLCLNRLNNLIQKFHLSIAELAVFNNFAIAFDPNCPPILGNANAGAESCPSQASGGPAHGAGPARSGCSPRC